MEKNIPKLRFPEFEGEWEETKLKEILKEGRLGGNYDNSESNNGIPVIKMGNLGRGNIVLDKIQSLPEDQSYNFEDILVEGDLLFNTRNTLDLVGKVAIWRNELPLALYNSNLLRLKFNRCIENSNRFMNYSFNTRKTIIQLRSFATGTTSVAAIYSRDLHFLKIKFPTLTEQTKIANFLTAVDHKISQLKKKKELLEQYKKGVMQKIFSQELRFKDENGEDYPEWEEKKLGEIVDINKGEQLNKEELTEIGEFPCINGGISPSGFTDKFNSNENTIVMSEGGASCGYLKLMDTKFWSGGHCYTLNIKNGQSTNTDYLFQLLKSNETEIMRLRVGSGLPNIQKKDISVFEISFSNSILEQTKIANFLSAIDEKISHCGMQIEKMEGWKKGLLQGMFV